LFNISHPSAILDVATSNLGAIARDTTGPPVGHAQRMEHSKSLALNRV
jgi:hypothetical protein